MPKRFAAKRFQRVDKDRQRLVGRNTRWGNPFPVGKVDLEKPPRLVRKYSEKWGIAVADLLCETNAESIARYREALESGRLDYSTDTVREELRGFDLGCPCGAPPGHCHADVLVEIANS